MSAIINGIAFNKCMTLIRNEEATTRLLVATDAANAQHILGQEFEVIKAKQVDGNKGFIITAKVAGEQVEVRVDRANGKVRFF